MSASDWQFPLADAPEDVRAPRAEDDRLDEPLYRAEMFCYDKSGYVEIRCAAGYLYSEDYVDLTDWQ